VRFDDGTAFLRADLSIACHNRRYYVGAVWAGLMVFVYPVGIPLGYLLLLWSISAKINPAVGCEVAHEGGTGTGEGAVVAAQAEAREADESTQYASFLYEAYQGRFWWWEPLECVRWVLRFPLTVLVFFKLDSVGPCAATGVCC
jgi:hypothetical protein